MVLLVGRELRYLRSVLHHTTLNPEFQERPLTEPLPHPGHLLPAFGLAFRAALRRRHGEAPEAVMLLLSRHSISYLEPLTVLSEKNIHAAIVVHTHNPEAHKNCKGSQAAKLTLGTPPYQLPPPD